MSNLKYAIIGVGGIGGYYGGRLAYAGEAVYFLFHNDYEYVKANGLKVDSVAPDGGFNIKVNVCKSAETMPECDVVLVCLKTTNNGLLKEILPKITHKGSLVVLIQNGLNMEQQLKQEFPQLNIGGGLAFICSSKVGPGHICHTDYGALTLGVLHGDDESLLKQFANDLSKTGVETIISDNLNYARWKKLVWNIPYNGMTVVLNATTAQLMQQKNTRQLMYNLMLEVIEAANACGEDLKKEFADQMMIYTDQMNPYSPSMKLDFDGHRPLEIEAIYSNPIESASRVGYDMSKTQELEQQLHFIQEMVIDKK